MSDSSNDGVKDVNKESEVSSSSASDRRQNCPAEQDEEEPKPRSLSPDTSDAVSAEQAGPSSQTNSVASSAHPVPLLSVETQGEALTSTTDNGRGIAESSHQEVGVSSGEPSAAVRSSQPAVSSALPDDTKSSSSDEYFEADASVFGPILELPDVSGSQEASLSERLSTTRHPWELDISSESNSQDAIAIISSGSASQQTAAVCESNSQEAEATLRHPHKSWEMLLSYESSTDEEVGESSNQQSVSQPCASRLPSAGEADAGPSHGAREISTTEQRSASPSNSQEQEARETVSGSVSGGVDEGASSSEMNPEETAAVSGSQDASQEFEAGSSSVQQTAQPRGQEAQEGMSNDQILTSSGQPTTSQESSVTESRRPSEEVESNQPFPSSQHMSDSNEDGASQVDDQVLTSSGQVSLSQEVSGSQVNCQEAEASAVGESVLETCEDEEAAASSQQQQLAPTVSGSDDLGDVLPVEQSSSHRESIRQAPGSANHQADVSGSSDSPEEEVGMSSSTQSAPRPDSPSSRRAAERLSTSQEAGPSTQQLSSSSSSQGHEVEMSSSSRMLQSGRLSGENQANNQPTFVSSASVDKPTESSDEEPGSASAQLSVSSATQRPQEPARMSVLAQQLTVSSASGRPVPGLQRLSSLSEAMGRHTSVGPDSTTMDQSAVDAGEEVSTTEEEAGQVSTSQQRVESTSWPPSRVSSSVDSSAAHISTSARLGGLLASRLSRDPQVSTSASAAPSNREADQREGGASSTTSGLRGLLSSGPRPAGVSSSRHPVRATGVSQQSAESVVVVEQAVSSLVSPPRASSSHQTSTSPIAVLSETLQLSEPSQSLSTAPGDPGDKFPNVRDKRGGKRRKKSPKPNVAVPPMPVPRQDSQAGPSGESSSLMEQLRKAGVIVTPVTQQASNITNFQCLSEKLQGAGTSVTFSHPSLSRVAEQIDSNSSDDVQVLGMFGEQQALPQQPEVLSLVSSADESTGVDDNEIMMVDQEVQEIPSGDGDKPKRKRRPRKPVEINPEMLRPKRPRRAKEKPESEEDAKEKPKRGRKKKVEVDAENKFGETTSARIVQGMEVEEEEEEGDEQQPLPPSVPDKPRGKEKVPKTPKVVREELLRPQDEETRMSADDSQQSRPLPSAESTPRKRPNAMQILPELDVVAESLVEYQWPLMDRLAESYMIQEQVTQYLGIKSFKRKYPDLKRRPVEPEEREFLQERGLVSESMCDLGLTAVQSSEVLDIMSADFQEKYEEYRRALRDKQAREVSGKQKAAAAASGERGRQVDQKTRAMQSAAKWNASLNRDRREERRCCCDLQTLSVQFPHARMKAMTRDMPKLGAYPVSLIPGQFTDFYKRYTPAELRYLPVNTVLYGPLRPNEVEERMSEGSPSDTEDSSSSDESSSSSSSDGTQDTEETGSTAAEPEPDIPASCASTGPPPGSKCKVCALPATTPDSMVTCAQCNSNGHLACLALSVDMLPHIRRYAWQCTDCKTCIQCKDPADEDKMLFCDMCDRGYHIYCVGLRKVPQGRWHCQECAVCGSCGSLDPAGAEALPVSPPGSPDKIPAQWQHEFKKGEKGTRVYAQTLCLPCSRLWRRGSFCQLCYRCFRKPDVTTMMKCSVCDKWMHAECCSLAPGTDLPKLAASFVCEVCQEGSQVRASTGRIVKMATRV